MFIRSLSGKLNLSKNCRLPALSLPPSYEGIYGTVRYEVGAVLIRPGHANKTTSVVLTVPSTLDSEAEMYDEPVETSVRKSVGLWLWNCGQVDCKASIPRQAYSSEETIPLTINIINQSTATLRLESIVLKQKTACKTPDDTRGPKTERIHELKFSETYLPHLKEIKRIIQFPIPPALIISPSIRTAILEVSHFLVIKVVAMGMKPQNEAPVQEKRRSKLFPWLQRTRSLSEGLETASVLSSVESIRLSSSEPEIRRSKSVEIIRPSIPSDQRRKSMSDINAVPVLKALNRHSMAPTANSSNRLSIAPSSNSHASNRHSLAPSVTSLGHFLTLPETEPSNTKSVVKKRVSAFLSDTCIKIEVPFVIGGFDSVLIPVSLICFTMVP